MRKINLEEELEKAKKYCKNNNNIFGTIEDMGIKHDKVAINYRVKQEYGFNTFFELLRSFGYGYKNDLIVNNKYKSTSDLKLEDIKTLLIQYKNTYNKIPSCKIDYCHKYNLPSYSKVTKVLKDNNLDIVTLYTELNFDLNNRNKTDEKYEFWLNKLKDKIKETGETPKYRDFFKWDDIPKSKWFLVHCKNEKVTDYNSFLEHELNMKPKYFMSKEMATNLILKCVNEIGKSPTKKELNSYMSESVIKRIWGSINKMKIDLGLDILGYNMQDKHIEFEELKIILLDACNKIIKEDKNKICITTKDISNNSPVKFGTIDRIFKLNNTTVRIFLESNGFKYQKEGQGYVYVFEDGEKTKSQFEFEFSKHIKNLGYNFNKDYFRDVRYRTFINNYNGLLDCDYEIHICNRIIYIEIAGMLRDYKHKYKTPKLINSKSKSKYAEKLNMKEKMFIDNNLEYYILFPSDLKDLDFLFTKILHINKMEGMI